MRKWLFVGGGGLLVLIGVLLLALTRLEVSAAFTSYLGVAGLLIMSAALLAYYAESHVLVALIPGCALAGLGLGILLAVLLQGPGVLFGLGGLGVGFIAVALIHPAVAGRRQTWALIPGSGLVALGAVIALAGSREDSQAMGVLVGAVLLVLGVWAVARQARSAKKV
jgi:hypothetical protein